MASPSPIDVDAYLNPISEDSPSGEDLTFDILFDEIQEARREDDPFLPQGAWASEVKVADWRQVLKLSGDALIRRSKALLLACWMTEALGRLNGLAGLTAGFRVTERLLADFWETLFPLIEEDDPVERVSRLDWLDRNLPTTLELLPLADPGGRAFGLRQWRESRHLENLALRDPQAAREAEEEGKVSDEAFMKAVTATPGEYYLTLAEDLGACREALAQLVAGMDEKLGRDAPNLGAVRQILEEIQSVVVRLAEAKGIKLTAPPPAEDQAAGAEAEAAGVSAAAAAAGPVAGKGPISSRSDALERLREVAEYFRRAEPHSPVAYLVDRAVRWGDMPLDLWLGEVVHDPSTLAGLRDLLGVRDDTQQ